MAGYFTKENAKEMQQRGLMKKMLFQTPERRSYLARRAVLRRWYPINAAPLDRVISLQRLFANEVVEFLLKDEHEKAVHAASAMLGWEKVRIDLETGAMKDVTPEISNEIESKLAKARERRDAALSEPVEVSATNAADPDHIPDKTP